MDAKLLDKLTEAIDAGEHRSPNPAIGKPMPHVFYNGKNFYIPNNAGGWVSVDSRSARAFLVKQGFSSRRADDEVQSEVDVMMIRIQTEHDVGYVGPLAGHVAGCHIMNGERILATSSPKFIEPNPGNFPVVRAILDNLLGPKQLVYFFGWLKVALEMFRTCSWQPGQVLALCGPVDAGKNLLRLIITSVLGGRVAFPHAHMIGQTNFNSDLFRAETLAIEDEQESVDIRARRKFGAAIKNFAVNQDQRCERKNQEALTLRVLRRLVISMNDEPERIQVLPPLDDDVADKLMIFKVEKRPMPVDTRTAAQKKAFWATIEAELPMLVHFLEREWEIPEELRDNRYGVRHYHHPDLVGQLREMSPEGHLFEIVGEVVFNGDDIERWEGTASALEAKLCAENSRCAAKARKLLAYANTCGTYLGRLERQTNLVQGHQVSGRTVWTILNPEHLKKEELRMLRRRDRPGRRKAAV